MIDTSVMFSSNSERKIKLKELGFKYFNVEIQKGSHDSVEDSKVSLSLAKLRVDILHHLHNPHTSTQEQHSITTRLNTKDIQLHLHSQGQLDQVMLQLLS